jgi:flagellar biosynthesis protein FliP
MFEILMTGFKICLGVFVGWFVISLLIAWVLCYMSSISDKRLGYK